MNMMAKKPSPPGKGLVKSQADAAKYVAEMSVVLRNLAIDVDLKFLSYLLEMAYEESLNHVNEKSNSAKK